MDLNDIPHVEGLSDASERHDIVMQLASEATDGRVFAFLHTCVMSA